MINGGARVDVDHRAILESTIAECQHLGHIVDNLLFLARTEASEAHLQRASFNGRAAIEKIAAFHELIAEEQNLTIRCEGAGTFVADEILFSRAVNNLVENAIKYAVTPKEEGAEIAVVARLNGDRVQIAVSELRARLLAEERG